MIPSGLGKACSLYRVRQSTSTSLASVDGRFRFAKPHRKPRQTETRRSHRICVPLSSTRNTPFCTVHTKCPKSEPTKLCLPACVPSDRDSVCRPGVQDRAVVRAFQSTDSACIGWIQTLTGCRPPLRSGSIAAATTLEKSAVPRQLSNGTSTGQNARFPRRGFDSILQTSAS